MFLETQKIATSCKKAVRRQRWSVIAIFFMEKFETMAFETTLLKARHWLHKVHLTFVLWSHGGHELNRFLKHLNSLNSTKRFTIER